MHASKLSLAGTQRTARKASADGPSRAAAPAPYAIRCCPCVAPSRRTCSCTANQPLPASRVSRVLTCNDRLLSATVQELAETSLENNIRFLKVMRVSQMLNNFTLSYRVGSSAPNQEQAANYWYNCLTRAASPYNSSESLTKASEDLFTPSLCTSQPKAKQCIQSLQRHYPSQGKGRQTYAEHQAAP